MKKIFCVLTAAALAIALPTAASAQNTGTPPAKPAMKSAHHKNTHTHHMNMSTHHKNMSTHHNNMSTHHATKKPNM